MKEHIEMFASLAAVYKCTSIGIITPHTCTSADHTVRVYTMFSCLP